MQVLPLPPRVTMGMAQTTSATRERQQDPLAFPGSEKLVKLIGVPCERPRMGDLPWSLRQVNVEWEPGYQDRQERAGRRGLPMVDAQLGR